MFSFSRIYLVKNLFIPLLFFSYFFSQLQADTPITVHLKTENQLMNVYIGDFFADASLSPQYVKKLKEVLQFDFKYNGTTNLIEQEDKKEQVFQEGGFEEFSQKSSWNSFNIPFVIKVQIKEKQLVSRILTVNKQLINKSEPLTLTGMLKEDRKKIHQLADSLHLALFDKKGVASTRFLYSIKKPTNRLSNNWISEIWEADYDGENAKQITHESSFCISPTYLPKRQTSSPDSFFYISYRTGQSKIFFANLRDGIGKRFSYLRGNQLMPALSPSGRNLAFISDITGRPDLFIQTFDQKIGPIGKPRQIYASPHATQASPTFSPDEKRLAFVSNKDGSPRIYIIKIPSTVISSKSINLQLITKENRENSAPSWSPDGSKIAYCAKTGDFRQIWMADLITGEETQLTTGNEHKENPTWGPDSSHIIYNSANENNSEMYLISINYTNPVKISKGQGEKKFPCWQHF